MVAFVGQVSDPDVTVVRFDLKMLKKVKLKNIVAQIEDAQIAGIIKIEAYPT